MQTHLAGPVMNPSPPFRGEREGPNPQGWEGEVGDGARSASPTSPRPSAPRGGVGDSNDGKGWRTPMNNEPDPIAFDPRGVVETEPLAVSERPAMLDGLRLGVLDNTKWNANRLLRKTVMKLQQEISFAEVNYYRKESFSKEADPALIAAIAADNDIVVTAIGD
jgi:hypothetical protein